MSYITDVQTNKTYTGNVVIQIGSQYFAIRQPDSGLVIASPYDKCVVSLILNPTTIDIRKVTTTISSFSFRLLDKDGIITAIVLGDARNLIGQQVRIFLGRSNVGMDFADYYELPRTYIIKPEHNDNTYTFSCSEQTERLARTIYNYKSALGAAIVAGTTQFTMRDDITDFPETGFLKVDNEFVSYSGKDLVNNRFTNVVRGELNSTPASHELYSDCVLVETITDNPLNIILKILISNGGGGTYDTLQDGLGISNTLIDIAEIEALRDELFDGEEFTLSLYNIESALKFIETELLMPNNLRFTNSVNSKLTLAILDKARFVEEVNVIDEDTITKYPKWSIEGNKVTNQIQVDWDFSEGTKKYNKRTIFTDATSIAAYGAQTPLTFSFKGIKDALDGENIINEFGNRLLARLAYPTPTIQINTQIDKSLQTIGDKAYLVSSKIPAADGTLNFSSDLEIISRAINHTNGDVSFTLAFTSFTNIRSAFIAPSDIITSSVSQKRVNVAEGRTAQYLVGWYMRLWDEVNQVYCADAPNKIVGFEIGSNYMLTEDGDRFVFEDGSPWLLEQDSTEDTIVFENDWTTILVPGQHRIRFATYDDVITSQKRYAFLSDGSNNFPDGGQPYKVTY